MIDSYRVEWKNVCARVDVECGIIVRAAPVLEWMKGKKLSWLLDNDSFIVIKLKGQ